MRFIIVKTFIIYSLRSIMNDLFKIKKIFQNKLLEYIWSIFSHALISNFRVLTKDISMRSPQSISIHNEILEEPRILNTISEN